MLIPQTKLPSYFYQPTSIISGDGAPLRPRFVDLFADPVAHSCLRVEPVKSPVKKNAGDKVEGPVNKAIVSENTPSNRRVLLTEEWRVRDRRDGVYANWLHCHGLRPKNMLWQLIRVHGTRHSSNLRREPWWDRFQDAVFRVFVQPETSYDPTGGWQQWYLLCPEDCEMVMRYRLMQKGIKKPPRNPITEKFISLDKELRKALLIPVECCKHYRHETTAGVLPEGL